MELKKSKKADLEKSISTFFSIGLIIALSLSLIAFEWSNEPNRNPLISIGDGGPIDIDILPPSTIQEKQKVEMPSIPPETFTIEEDHIKIDDFIDWGTDIIRETDSLIISIPQPDDEPDVPEEYYIIPGEMPTFKNGNLQSFVIWAQKNLDYPSLAAENGVEGKVYLEFIVEKDGALSHVQVLKGPDQALNNEALRVIRTSPKWAPGKHNGFAVRVKCSMMVNFVLQR